MGAPDFLSFARLMNGVCATCGKINAHDGSPRCDCVRQERDSSLDRDGWPKRWGSKTYLGDGPWGA